MVIYFNNNIIQERSLKIATKILSDRDSILKIDNYFIK